MQPTESTSNGDKAFHFADGQWEAVTKYVSTEKLAGNNTARARIEESIGLYQTFKRSMSGLPAPSENSKKLEQVRDAAAKVSGMFNGISYSELVCLLDTNGSGLRIHGLEKFAQAKVFLNDIQQWLGRAVERSKIDKKSSGPDSGNEDFLIACLNNILHKFADQELSRAKSDVAFVEQIFQYAGYPVSANSIEASIRRLNKNDDLKSVA